MRIPRLCILENCNGKHEGKGYCNKHYQRLVKHGDPLYEPIRGNGIKNCRVFGCDGKGVLDANGKRYFSNGLCQKHYLRHKRHSTLFIDNGRRTPEKHSMTGSPEYIVWIAMKQRCNDKNASNYFKYGGKGIKVCDRWNNSFIAFYKDMGKRPDGYSIDRIDGDKGYSPDNCRWADIYTQNRNRNFNTHDVLI